MKKVKIILLHGWLFDSLVWTNLKKKLSCEYDTFSPDLPGYGKNSSNQSNIKFLNNYVSEINDDCVIVGWSYGGIIAKKCMVSNKLIKKVILINSYLLSKTSFISINSINLLIKELQIDRNKAIKNFIFECCKNSPTPISDMKKINKQMLKTKYPSNEVLISNLEEMKVISSDINFKNINYKRIFFIFGQQDQFSKSSNLKLTENMKVVERMGHLPFYSSCDEVLESIKSFLCEAKSIE